METSFEDYSTELNQTPAFWELTRRAHQDSVILRLGRLYDPHSAATSLGNLFQTMKEHAANAATPLPPLIATQDTNELNSDMTSVSEDDPAVAKLLLVRNEYLAHRGTRHVTRGAFDAVPTLERNEIATLLDRALSSLTKYREKLGYRPLLWGHHEEEEFRQLLLLIRAGFNAQSDGC